MKTIFFFILFSLAFLTKEHYYPWPTYESERYIFYAASFFCLIYIYINKKIIRLDITHIFLILLLMCSFFSYSYYEFKQYFYIFNLYLINLIVFSIVVKNSINNNLNIIDIFLGSLLFVGVISAIFSLYQWMDVGDSHTWLYPAYGNRFSANLAQPNHLATLLLISLFSCLFISTKLKTKLILFFVPLLVFSLALTQSRTVWLVLICILVMTGIKWRIIGQQVKCVIFLLTPIYIMFGYFISLNNGVNIGARATTGFLRLLMWGDFFEVLPHLNFLGIGWKNVEYYQFFYGDKSSEYVVFYHNILLDLIVLFGFLGFVFFAYMFLKLLLVFKKIDNTKDFLIFLILFVLINHSLFEYPLFYNYFLLIFIVLFFYLDSKYNLYKYHMVIGRSFFAVVAVIIITLTFMYTQYFEKNRHYYRAVFMGKCMVDFEKNIIFDEFNNLSLVNCKENISYKNLPKFESALLQRPSPNNILKLVYIYQQVGEYHKRDELLKRYNVKYFPKYALSEVLEIDFF